MRSERVPLQYLSDETISPFTVTLREPCGQDELAVTGIDTRSAVTLLDRLLDTTDRPGFTGAIQLSANDRDALLAALHRLCWGDRIVATVACADCKQYFDLSFGLTSLQRELYGACTSPGSWRVPTAEDELASAATYPVDAVVYDLAQRCGVGADELEAAAAALESAAPILDVDLQAVCPECGTQQSVQFDVQSFLLRRLLAERTLLLDEVHILASRYSWPLNDILGLARSTRRTLVQRVVNERSA